MITKEEPYTFDRVISEPVEGEAIQKLMYHSIANLKRQIITECNELGIRDFAKIAHLLKNFNDYWQVILQQTPAEKTDE